MGKYGSRKGEVRLDANGDPMKSQPAKIMDDGGDIPMPNSTADANNAATANAIKAMTPDKQAPAATGGTGTGVLNQLVGKNLPSKDTATPGMTTMNMGGSVAAPAMPSLGTPTGTMLPPIDDKGADIIGGTNIPVADQGMDAAAPVDIHDGLHSVAILKQGEKVLNPDEANEYRAAQGEPQMKPLGQSKAPMQQMSSSNDTKLPDAPEPQPKVKPEDKFWTPERKAETAALAGEAAGDTYTTHEMMKHSGVYEADPLAAPLVNKGLGGQIAAGVLGPAAVLGAEYGAKKLGFPRVSKAIGRIAPMVEGINVARQFKMLPEYEKLPLKKYDEGGNVEVKPEDDMASRVAYAKGVGEPEAHGEAGKKQWDDFVEHPKGLATDAPQKYKNLARFSDTSGPYSAAPKGSALMTPPAWRPTTDSYDEASTMKTPPAANARVPKELQGKMPVMDTGGDIGMRQLGSEYPVLPTPESKGDNILENTQNFDQGGDILPPEAETAPAEGAQGKPMAQMKPPAPDPTIVEAGMKEMGTHPSQQPQPAQPAPAEPELKGTDAERTAIEHDKKMAMGSGNLVKLGTALLNERHLSPMKSMKVMDSGGDVVPELVPADPRVPENQLKAPRDVNQFEPPPGGDPNATTTVPKQVVNESRMPSMLQPSAGPRQGPANGATGMKQMQIPEPSAAPVAAAPQAAPQAATATQPQDMYQASAGGSLRPGTEPTGQGETKGQQRDLAKMEHQAKIKDYDAKIQQALDSATPEGKELADRLSYAKQSYLAHSPWGSEGNHPGVLGKIAHGLARTGEIAADIAAPGLTQGIPNTPERMAREQAGTQATMQADTALQTARNAEENKGDKTVEGTLKEATQGGMVDPNAVGTPMEGVPQQTLYNDKTGKLEFKGPMPPKEGSAAAKPATSEDLADYKQRIAAAGLDPKSDAYKTYSNAPANISKAELDKRLAEAMQLRGMNQKDAETQVTNKAREDAAAEHKDEHYSGKTFVFTEPDKSRVAMSYEQAKAEGRNVDDAEMYSGQATQKLREQNNSYTAATKAFDRYQTDQEKWYQIAPAQITKDKEAMQVLTSHSDVKPSGLASNLAEQVSSGAVDLLLGKPFTGYSDKLMGGHLTQSQYDDLSSEGRKSLNDYFTAMLSHFASMKAQQGSIPRNPMMIQTEMNAIPLPYLSPNEAKPAFDNYRDRLSDLNQGNVSFGGKSERGAGNKAGEAKTAPPAAGTIEQGHRFLGGDPSKPESWEKIAQ
jgi:hypothetical protein